MYSDFFSINGIPQGLVVSLSVLLFLIAVAPLFSGLRVFGVDFPPLTRLGKVIAPLVGATGLFLVVLGFQPRWVDENELKERLPYCTIKSWPVDGEYYLVDWFVQPEIGSWTTVTRDGAAISSLGDAQQKFKLDEIKGVVSYKVLAGNRYGTCDASISVWDQDIDYTVPLNCTLEISKSSANQGEKYRLTWNVTGPQFFVVYINGSEVDAVGAKTFTFDAPNYSRFRLVANAGGNTCQKDARITAN